MTSIWRLWMLSKGQEFGCTLQRKIIKGRIKGLCNYCKKEYLVESSNGTSTITAHIDACSKYPPNIEKLKAKGQKFFVPRKGSNTKEIDMTGVCTSDELIRLCVEMIILDELPFCHVEGEGFIRMMNRALPYWKLPCRKRVAKDVLKIYLEEKEKLKDQLKGRKICLTTDIWTSLQNISYMVVIGHFIDDDWFLQKRVLNFCPIVDHKGDSIANILEYCLEEWNIEKILTMTVDNASANDVAIRELIKRHGDSGVIMNGGRNLHMRCMAHILNLVVGDGLKPMTSSIDVIRNAVRYVRSSPQRLELFRKCMERVKIDSKGLVILDVPTRWNSTFLMLESALKFPKAFERLYVDDTRFKGLPSSNDWKNAKVFSEFLKPFYEVTLKVCCSNTPTIHQAFGDVLRIHDILQEQTKKPKVLEMFGIAPPMQEKYISYWGDLAKLNQYVFVALILDPRHKLDKLQDYLEIVFDEEEEGNEEVDNVVKEKVDVVVKEVKKLMNDLYILYEQESGIGREDGISQDSLDVNDPSLFVGLTTFQRKEKEKELKRKTMKSVIINNDLDRYMSDPREKDFENFEVLDWWKVNGVLKYPILSLIARDILAIPVSTISSESSFSTSGRVINPHRCSLSPKTVEALICTQSWLKGESIALQHVPTIEEMEICEEAEREMMHMLQSSGSGMLSPSLKTP